MSLTFLSGIFYPAQTDTGPGTVVVNAFANIFTTVAATDALSLSSGAWTITVNGGIYAGDGDGIHLTTASPTPSTITVGLDGDIWGGGSPTGAGINAAHTVSIKNAGGIRGFHTGIRTGATVTITNNKTGVIEGGTNGIQLGGGGTHTITNAGLITGVTRSIFGSFGPDVDKITNSGIINGAVLLYEGNDSVTNSGTIFAGSSLYLGDGNDKLTNSGRIQGSQIDFGTTDSGIDTLINSGEIIGMPIAFGDGNDTLKNTGTLSSGSSADLGDGDNIVTNSKFIDGGVTCGSGKDVVTNSGTIDDSVSLGGGDDTFTNFVKVKTVTTSGVVAFGVILGDGNDKFFGGNNGEIVGDGNGTDTLKFGGGNDRYDAVGNTGSDGLDVIDGGKNGAINPSANQYADTYNASSAASAVRINIDTVFHLDDVVTSFGLNATEAKGSAADIGTTDKITGFESVFGGMNNDVIFGNAVANYLGGGSGDDVLYGLAGADYLDGGDGVDHLLGGGGKDMLSANMGPGFGDTFVDTFYFRALSDTAPGAANRDVVTDFEDGVDLIDLTGIEAATAVSLTFIGTNVAFTGTAGDLRAVWAGSNSTVVQGDINGDKKPDFAIEIFDNGHTTAITGADFV